MKVVSEFKRSVVRSFNIRNKLYRRVLGYRIGVGAAQSCYDGSGNIGTIALPTEWISRFSYVL